MAMRHARDGTLPEPMASSMPDEARLALCLLSCDPGGRPSCWQLLNMLDTMWGNDDGGIRRTGCGEDSDTGGGGCGNSGNDTFSSLGTESAATGCDAVLQLPRQQQRYLPEFAASLITAEEGDRRRPADERRKTSVLIEFPSSSLSSSLSTAASAGSSLTRPLQAQPSSVLGQCGSGGCDASASKPGDATAAGGRGPSPPPLVELPEDSSSSGGADSSSQCCGGSDDSIDAASGQHCRQQQQHCDATAGWAGQVGHPSPLAPAAGAGRGEGAAAPSEHCEGGASGAEEGRDDGAGLACYQGQEYSAWQLVKLLRERDAELELLRRRLQAELN